MCEPRRSTGRRQNAFKTLFSVDLTTEIIMPPSTFDGTTVDSSYPCIGSISLDVLFGVFLYFCVPGATSIDLLFIFIVQIDFVWITIILYFYQLLLVIFAIYFIYCASGHIDFYLKPNGHLFLSLSHAMRVTPYRCSFWLFYSVIFRLSSRMHRIKSRLCGKWSNLPIKCWNRNSYFRLHLRLFVVHTVSAMCKKKFRVT